MNPLGPGVFFGKKFLYLIECPFPFSVCSDFQFLLDSVLICYMFLGIYSFLLGYSICWHILFHSGLLWFSVFLWYQLGLLFHFWSYFFESCFFLISLAKGLSNLLILLKTQLFVWFVFSIVFLISISLIFTVIFITCFFLLFGINLLFFF